MVGFEPGAESDTFENPGGGSRDPKDQRRSSVTAIVTGTVARVDSTTEPQFRRSRNGAA